MKTDDFSFGSAVSKKRLGSSSVARGGGARAPHCSEKYAKLHVFGTFEADFCSENENSPSKDLGTEVVKELSCCGRKNS